MDKKKLLFALFIIVSLLYIIGILLDNLIIRFTFKPLIMLALMMYYSSSVKYKNNVYLAALFFSFFGDTMLLYESETSFMIGLISFLIAHVLFIIMVVRMLSKSEFKLKIASSIPFIISYGGLLFLLKDNLSDMFLPVAVYGFVISIFGSVSVLNYLSSRNKEGLYLMVGSILFVISDSILAINKFNQSQEYYPIIIITTYILAQYLICQFAIIKTEQRKSAVI